MRFGFYLLSLVRRLHAMWLEPNWTWGIRAIRRLILVAKSCRRRKVIEEVRRATPATDSNIICRQCCFIEADPSNQDVGVQACWDEFSLKVGSICWMSWWRNIYAQVRSWKYRANRRSMTSPCSLFNWSKNRVWPAAINVLKQIDEGSLTVPVGAPVMLNFETACSIFQAFSLVFLLAPYFFP